MCFKLLRIVWPERTRNTRADLELAGVDALETQYLALDNARVILLKAADLVANDDATSELQAAGQVAMEIFDCIRVGIMPPSMLLACSLFSYYRRLKQGSQSGKSW